MFYTNRVLKEYKGKNEDHVNWTKLMLGMLNELINYIKAHHTTGLVWNVKVCSRFYLETGFYKHAFS